MDPMAPDADRLFAEYRRTQDPGALGALYDLVAPKLLRIALHATWDAVAAEDVLQATFVTVIERAGDFEAGRGVLPWMTGILANHARGARARRERARTGPAPAHEPAAEARASPVDDAQRAELLERLEQALDELPEAFRPVIALRVRHGLSTTEIAQALGRPSGTVRSQLARGLEQLRRALPIGLAGSLLATFARPTRGLAAVREAVVVHASTVSLVGVSALSGVLAMKKVLVLTGVLAALFVAWRFAPRDDAAPLARASRDPAGELAAAPESAGEESARVPWLVAPGGDAEHERVALPAERAAPAVEVGEQRPPEVATSGALEVRVRWKESGFSAEGELVLVTRYGIPESLPDDSLVQRTDAEGLARFDELPPGPTHVRLLRGGEDSLSIWAGRTATLELAVFAGADVGGQVVDGQGLPIAGAEIWLSERYRTNLGHFVSATDLAGRFAVRSVGLDHYLGARADGYAPSRLRAIAGRPGESLELRIVLDRPGVRMRGRVVDGEGSGVRHALVLVGDEQPAITERADDGLGVFGAPPVRVKTDERGEFELRSVPLGTLAVQARAPGFAPYRGELDTGAAGAFLSIRLASEARVTGTVRDVAGLPVAGAWIHTGSPELFAAARAWSARDGSFELAGLAAGEVELVAQSGTLVRAQERLRLSAGETARWDPVLGTGPGLHGRVLDEHGDPVAGAIVVATPRPGSENRARSQPADAQGRFALHGLEAGRHLVWVQAPGGWREFPLLALEHELPDSTPLELRLPDPGRTMGRIVGTVLGPEGRPVTGAHVDLWHEGKELWRSFLVDGTSGELAVERVPAGPCSIEVRHPDFPWTDLGTRTVEAGATLDLGEIRFESCGRVRGTLRGVPEAVLAGIRPSLTGESNRSESGVVHLTGREYRSGPLAPGRHVLAFAGDFVRTTTVSIEVVAGAEEVVDVELEPCGMRRVLLQIPPGEPRPSWLGCSVFDPEGNHVWSGGKQPDGSGNAELRVSVAPGSYRLVASTPEGLEARAVLELARLDGGEPLLHVVLARP